MLQALRPRTFSPVPANMCRNKSVMDRVDCPQCGKSLCSQYSVKRHVQACHLQLRKFMCDICYKPLSSKQNLRMHKHRHLRDALRPSSQRASAPLDFSALLTKTVACSFTDPHQIPSEKTESVPEWARLPPIAWERRSTGKLPPTKLVI